MIDKVKTNCRNILLPAIEGDAGFDLIASSEPKIIGNEVCRHFYDRIDYIEYDTDVIIEPPKGFHSYIMPRSSNSRTNLILSNSIGLIDNGYRGTLKLRFKYVPQPKDYKVMIDNSLCVEVDQSAIYQIGQKIAQLVFAQTLSPELTIVDSFSETKRQSGGYGSTGL